MKYYLYYHTGSAFDMSEECELFEFETKEEAEKKIDELVKEHGNFLSYTLIHGTAILRVL